MNKYKTQKLYDMSKDEFKALLADLGRDGIIREHAISLRTLCRVLKHHDLQNKTYRKKGLTDDDKKEMRRLHLEERLTQREVGERFDISQGMVSRSIKEIEHKGDK